MTTGNQDLNQFFHNCNQAMGEYQKLHMNAAKQLGDLQLTFMNLCMEYQRDQLDRLAKSETASDIVATESGIASEYMNKFANNAQQTFDTLNKLQDEMFSWMQNNPVLGQFNHATGNKIKTTKQSA